MASKKDLTTYNTKKWTIIGISIGLILIFFLLNKSPVRSFFFLKGASVFVNPVSVVAALIIFYYVDKTFDIKFKKGHYVLFMIILTFGVLLSPFYFLYPFYDKALHLFMPILLGSIVFHLIKPIKTTLKQKLALTFFVVLGILGLFEIGEYLLDLFLGWKLQGVYQLVNNNLELIQSPLVDTMTDMMLGVAGTLTYVLSSAFFSRRKTKGQFRTH
jgi:hypothetical protein